MKGDARPTLVYRRRDALYVNLTNRCPTACVFCVKRPWRMGYEGYNLRLSREPSAERVLEALRRAGDAREVVFCGFGESTFRLAEMIKIGRRLAGGPFRRLNTVGLGSLINGRDIVPELAGAIDGVSVSLNAADPRDWRRLHRPSPRYREPGFSAVLDFIRRCAKSLRKTTVTAIELPGADLRRVRTLARSLGAVFRSRPVLSPP